MPTLKKGSTGPAVERVQVMLNRLGYGSLKIDGHYGPATVAAVKAFQQKHALTVDGKCGPKTQEKLDNYQDQVLGSVCRSCIRAIECLPDFQQLEVLLHG